MPVMIVYIVFRFGQHDANQPEENCVVIGRVLAPDHVRALTAAGFYYKKMCYPGQSLDVRAEGHCSEKQKKQAQDADFGRADAYRRGQEDERMNCDGG